MLKFDLKVTYPDDTVHEITTGNPDVIRLEKQYGISMSAMGDDLHAEHITFLAWSALRRRDQGVHPEFAEFCDQVDVEIRVSREDLDDQRARLDVMRAEGKLTEEAYTAAVRQTDRALMELDAEEVAQGAKAKAKPGKAQGREASST